MKKLKVCVVGLGRAGQIHLNSIGRLPDVVLKYVLDPKEELARSIADQENCRAVSQMNIPLQDGDLDAVIIASPTHTHYDYIISALQAGKHVFTEKPLGNSISEIKECYKLAHQKGLSLSLGFQRRIDKNFKAFKAKLPQIGQLHLVQATSRDNPKPSLEYLRKSKNIFHDMLIHDFDMMTFLLGPGTPESVYAVGHAHDPEIAKNDDFDTVLVTIKYPSGLIYSIDTSRAAVYGYDQRLEAFGEDGMLLVENERENTVQHFTGGNIGQSVCQYSFPQRYRDAYCAEMQLFTSEILHSKQAINVSMEECLLSHLLADAAYQSAKTTSCIDFRKFFRNHG